MPMMPPRARAATLRVPAVPKRKEGTDKTSATMGMTVVTAVPIPAIEEKAYAQLRRFGLTKAMSPTQHESFHEQGI